MYVLTDWKATWCFKHSLPVPCEDCEDSVALMKIANYMWEHTEAVYIEEEGLLKIKQIPTRETYPAIIEEIEG